MSDENSTPVETKIVITHKGNGATIGIQRTNCDPAFFKVEGDISTAVNRIPELIEEAGKRWQTSPRYPEAELPAPPPTSVTTHASSAPTTPSTSPNKQQEAMF